MGSTGPQQQQPPQQQNMSGGGKGYSTPQGYGPSQGYNQYGPQQGYGQMQGYGYGQPQGYGQQPPPFFNNGQGSPWEQQQQQGGYNYHQDNGQMIRQQIGDGSKVYGALPPGPNQQGNPADDTGMAFSQQQMQQNIAQGNGSLGSTSQPMPGETYPQYQQRTGGQQPTNSGYNAFQQQQQFGNAGGKGPSPGDQQYGGGQGAGFAHGGKVRISKNDLDRIVKSVNTAKKVAGE
jgi:hypothetical protein